MEIYLPVVQVHIDVIFILFVSFAVGVLSGLFGVGGGFLMTPFLIFLGIPPVYAVPNEINNILATSVSGSMTHWFKNTLDYKMGLMIIIGGVPGTILGIITFTFFKETGKLSLIISLSYMYLLAIIGTLMLIEGAKEIDRARKKIVLKKNVDFSIVDFHGEITSEKMAIGHYFDGLSTCVVGTHTHVPTADTRILEKGTAYQTDIGMCGDCNSVIGMNKENSLKRFFKQDSEKHYPSLGDGSLSGVMVDCDETTGLAKNINSIIVGGVLNNSK